MHSPIRRPLVRRSLVLAASAALLLGVAGAAAPAAAAGPPPTNTRVAGINVDAATIPQLQSLMNRHRLTAVQLVQFYLHRIARLNPRLHAVIRVSPTALADARRADALRRRGDHRPLLGIPVLVKDNVDVRGMPTTAGSWALAGSRPGDAFIIRRLRAAGAIVIAKANLSEWANFRSGPSSSGWSGVGGQVNMPYVLDRNPCGSSSGTGAGIAADLATVGIGTETDGSIVCPSGANGLVGIKPTLGLWSRAGVVPISAEQDTAGPMARNVTDAAVLLGALTGVDPNDPATADQVGHAFTNYRQFLDRHALEGARIGVWRETTYDPSLTGPVVEPILADVIATLEDQGATVVDHTDIDMTAAFTNEFPALLCEFKSDIASYLQRDTAAGFPKTLAALIAFDQAHPNLEGPWNDAVFEAAEATNGRDADCAALRAATTPPTQDALDAVLADNHLDAVIALTNGPAWPTNDNPDEGDLNGHFEYFVGSSTASAVSGYGSITVPAGHVQGLPIGISFIGGRWSEPQLLGYAYDFEQATHVRVPPTFKATIGDALFPGVPNPAPAVATERVASPEQRGAAPNGHMRVFAR